MATTETDLLTLAAYAAWDESENEYVTELVRGVIVREPRPGAPHGRAQVELAWRLRSWVQAVGKGEVLTESGFILSEDPATVRGPDVALLLEPRSSQGEPGGWIRGAPDVAVEVVSPSDTVSAIQRKTLDYLGAGALRVWVVDPAEQSVTVYRPDGSATLMTGERRLTDEDLLPGFSLQLKELFGG